MWTIDDFRPYTLNAPLEVIRAMSPEEREKHVAEYKRGFKINAIN